MIVPEPALTLVTDRGRLAGRSLAELAVEAAQAGVDWIQVREKDLSDRNLRALVSEVVSATAGTRTRVLVNGRPDIALVAGASGVQLPEAGLAVADVKRGFATLVVGASCHSLEAARRAETAGADFVVLGPIFATPGKQARSLGAAALADVVRRVRVPVHAIGGIDAVTARVALDAGARGLAGIRVFLNGPLARCTLSLRRPT